MWKLSACNMKCLAHIAKAQPKIFFPWKRSSMLRVSMTSKLLPLTQAKQIHNLSEQSGRRVLGPYTCHRTMTILRARVPSRCDVPTLSFFACVCVFRCSSSWSLQFINFPRTLDFQYDSCTYSNAATMEMLGLKRQCWFFSRYFLALFLFVWRAYNSLFIQPMPLMVEKFVCSHTHTMNFMHDRVWAGKSLQSIIIFCRCSLSLPLSLYLCRLVAIVIVRCRQRIINYSQ